MSSRSQARPRRTSSRSAASSSLRSIRHATSGASRKGRNIASSPLSAVRSSAVLVRLGMGELSPAQLDVGMRGRGERKAQGGSADARIFEPARVDRRRLVEALGQSQREGSAVRGRRVRALVGEERPTGQPASGQLCGITGAAAQAKGVGMRDRYQREPLGGGRPAQLPQRSSRARAGSVAGGASRAANIASAASRRPRRGRHRPPRQQPRRARPRSRAHDRRSSEPGPAAASTRHARMCLAHRQLRAGGRRPRADPPGEARRCRAGRARQAPRGAAVARRARVAGSRPWRRERPAKGSRARLAQSRHQRGVA